jgi:uncharacterized membrane protein
MSIAQLSQKGQARLYLVVTAAMAAFYLFVLDKPAWDVLGNAAIHLVIFFLALLATRRFDA